MSNNYYCPNTPTEIRYFPEADDIAKQSPSNLLMTLLKFLIPPYKAVITGITPLLMAVFVNLYRLG
jgi:hypothetical protein